MNQTTLFYVAAGLFFLTAIINFVSNNSAQGATFIALGAAFTAIGASYRNRGLAATPVELSDVQQREVQTLIADGKQTEAVKRVSEETGVEFKEAKEYVDRMKPQTAD